MLMTTTTLSTLIRISPPPPSAEIPKGLRLPGLNCSLKMIVVTWINVDQVSRVYADWQGEI